jgi:hypothetical protein
MATNTPPERAVVPDAVGGRPAASGWSSWVMFAGVLLILLGGFHALEGIAALSGRGTAGGALVDDATVSGWLHLVLGVVGALIGLGLLAGNAAARVGAVVLAALSAVGNLTLVSASPVGALLLVAVDVLVIYAVIVHGGDLRSPSYY